MMMDDIQDVFPPQIPLAVLTEPEMDLEAPPPPALLPPNETELPQPLHQPTNPNHPPRPRTCTWPPPQLPPEWLNLIMSFGFAAISFRSQSQNSGSPPSLSFHMAFLCLVLALSALTVSKYTNENLRTMAQILEHAGVYFGFTAFFVAVTPTFPLFLQIIVWFAYVLSIAVIIFSHLGFL